MHMHDYGIMVICELPSSSNPNIGAAGWRLQPSPARRISPPPSMRPSDPISVRRLPTGDDEDEPFDSEES
jgi:hypothetical protein